MLLLPDFLTDLGRLLLPDFFALLFDELRLPLLLLLLPRRLPLLADRRFDLLLLPFLRPLEVRVVVFVLTLVSATGPANGPGAAFIGVGCAAAGWAGAALPAESG